VSGVREVLFVCIHNAGRSQMAAALLDHHARGTVQVRSAGSEPADRIHPTVVAAMNEVGLDLSGAFPKPLTDDAVRVADVVITMGCGDACPVFPGKRYVDWDVEDPAGKALDDVRAIRDDIDRRVQRLLNELRQDEPRLSGLELFADCDDDDLARLAARLSRRDAHTGEVLMRQGEPGRWFLLVVEGEAAVTHDDGGGERTMGKVTPGSIVGELSVLRATPRSATVTASCPLIGFVGDARAFSELLDAPGVAERVSRTVRQRLVANSHPVVTRLRDGTRLALRAMLPTDRAKFADFQARLSPESYYRRFFSPPPLSDRVVEYLIDVDYVDRFAWAALASDEPGEPVLGSAHYIREADGSDIAEVAISVIDQYQGRGLGTLLVGALSVAAAENGVRRFRARVLAENAPMRAILDRAGARWRFDEPGVLETVVDVPTFGGGVPDTLTTSALRDTVRAIVAAADLALAPAGPAPE